MTQAEGNRGFGLFLGVILLLATAVVFGDSLVRFETIQKISAQSFTDIPPGTRPIPPGSREEFLVPPASSMDAKWWILYAQDFLQGPSWTVRATPLDNAPDGREVHWSSLLIWVIAAVATILSWFNGASAVENCAAAAMLTGPLLLVASSALLGGLAWLRFGWTGALALLVIFLTNPTIYRTFHFGEADHHGIVLVLAMGCVFCLVAGGGGFVRGKSKKDRTESSVFLDLQGAQKWFWASGFFGGAALWVSAATMLPILAALGFAALCAGFFGRKMALESAPELWRHWAMAGFLSSMGFYFLEYFPGYFGLRLEVNHPAYAVGWLGGGLLLQWLLSWIASGKRPRSMGSLVAGVLCALLPLGLLFFGKSRIFYVSDPFLLALHKEYIMEFQSFFTFLKTSENPGTWFFHYGWPVFGLLFGLLAIGRGWLSPLGKIALPFLLAPTMMMQSLAIWQVRWGYAAMGMWTLCAFFLVMTTLANPGPDRVSKSVTQGSFGLVATFALLFSFAPQMVASYHFFESCLEAPIQEKVGNSLLLRDISHRLLQSSPNNVPVVLSGPNSSTEMAYFGRIRVLGTLYWENMPGLKRAAKIFAAKDEEEAKALLEEAGVTHIVIPSWENFGAPYARLYSIETGEEPHPDGAPFFKALIEGSIAPPWLRPFCYPIPTATGIDGTSVRIFAFLPQQSAFEAALFQGIYHFEAAEFASAESNFRRAALLRPSDPRPHHYLAALAEKLALPDVPKEK